MFKKAYIQILAVMLLLFVSSDIVVASIEAYSKKTNIWTEISDTDEIDEIDNLEEDLDTDNIFLFSKSDLFYSNPSFEIFFIEITDLTKNEVVSQFKSLCRKPKTPLFILNQQIKISC
jgi:hypothetical protein